MAIPRPEYPRPQFVREGWLNLNGQWQFEIDHGCSGEARGLVEAETLSGEITVPFCPESRLSGVEYKDFMHCVWYKRLFVLPPEAQGQRVFIRFGAADYRTRVWVNGVLCGKHEGGYTSFGFEITKAVQEGLNMITVCCEDDNRDPMQPRGKQSELYHSHKCDYTRTTGIWQTVWLEWTGAAMMEQVFITPDAENARVSIRVKLSEAAGCVLAAEAYFEGDGVGAAVCETAGDHAEISIDLANRELWDIGQPNLYDLKLTLSRDGEIMDCIDSYFGLRSVAIANRRFLLNGRPIYQRLVLDQGFYPDGIYTAPTDEALKRDIELSLAMGFNGARLHQKVFEARFLYWADHLGYLCWGEMGSWGLDHSQIGALAAFQKEWLEAVERDYSAPCIIGWCPFNETWDVSGHAQNDDVLALTYRLTKALDKTRPCIDTSGNYHVITDIYDVHDYNQDPAVFRERYNGDMDPIYERFPKRQQPREGELFFMSEYGGIRWSEGDGWGYGEGPKTKEEFLARYQGLTEPLQDNPSMMGFCYTQLTDVEQEQNGLYTYDRVPKFDPAVIAAFNKRKAACEE